MRCGATLVKRSWFGRDTTLPFVLAGLALSLPAALSSFVTLGKFGLDYTSHLVDVAGGYWRYGLQLLAAWVWFCGVLAPFGLLLVLLAARLGERAGFTIWPAALARLAERLEFWAMPEVQVLGVLVAFFKLGDVVDVSVGPGLWCYSAGAVFMLLAWRQHSLRPRGRTTRSAAAPGAMTNRS